MQLIDNTNYKFEKENTECDTYQVKMTTELLEELENCQNINEVILNINKNSGTLTIPSKNKKSKIFDLNIGPISQGEKESFEVNAIKLNKRVERLGSLQVRLNVQATAKVYDMTKKKISEVEDESKKHCAKELKLDKFSNKQGLAYKVMKQQEARKSEGNSRGHVSHNSNEKSIDKNDFTIRQKILHLLAVSPMSKDALLLRLQRLKVTSVDRPEVDKCLSQLTTLNKDNMYQLSSQFIPEILEDWSYYNDEEKRKVIKLKMESKANISNRIPQNQISRHSKRPLTPDSHENTRPKAPLAPHPSKTKIAALDMMAKGKHISEISRFLNVPENVLNSWKSNENQIRQSFESSKRSADYSNIDNHSRESKTSSSSGNNKSVFSNRTDEDSNSSFKNHTSQDEGFISGDKRSPPVRSHQKNTTVKRKLHHFNDSDGQPESKKMLFSLKDNTHIQPHNDVQSSSSCEVTPKSDISQSSRSSLPNKFKSDKNNQFTMKSNSKTIFETQNLFNIAFEEYSKLCETIKECESKIENLRSKCQSGPANYTKLYKLAKSLLSEMESPKFQALTARVKKLELDMFDYLKILNNV